MHKLNLHCYTSSLPEDYLSKREMEKYMIFKEFMDIYCREKSQL